MSAVLWWVLPPSVWCVAMVVREWVHTRQHARKLSRHQMELERHDAAIEAALLGERSLLETRLSGVMSDALRAAMGDDYPLAEFEPTPLHDETVQMVFSAELAPEDLGPDDLGWSL